MENNGVIKDINKIVEIRKRLYKNLMILDYQTVKSFNDMMKVEMKYKGKIEDYGLISLADKKLVNSMVNILTEYYRNFNDELDCLRILVLAIAEGNIMTIELLTDELGNLNGENITDIIKYIKTK